MNSRDQDLVACVRDAALYAANYYMTCQRDRSTSLVIIQLVQGPLFLLSVGSLSLSIS